MRISLSYVVRCQVKCSECVMYCLKRPVVFFFFKINFLDWF